MTTTVIVSMIFCREGIENVESLLLFMPFLSLPIATNLDNICFTFMTSFPLQFSRLALTPFRDLLRQFDQVRHSKK